MNSANPLMPKRIANWVKKYFLHSEEKKKNDPNVFISPLYFQHMGHSMTIVGIEYTKTSENLSDIEIESLIIFDPDDCQAKKKQIQMEKVSDMILKNDKSIAQLTLAHHQWKKIYINNITKFNKSNYQIVYIASGLMTDNEREKSKIIRGHREHLPIIDQSN